MQWTRGYAFSNVFIALGVFRFDGETRLTHLSLRGTVGRLCSGQNRISLRTHLLYYSSKPMNKLFIICGLSFAGKSTLAQAMVESLGHEEVDVDNTKIALYGSNVQDNTLTREEWDRVYEETDRQIIDLLNSGKNVIDASRYFTRAERSHIRSIADTLGCQTVTIYVTTSEAIVRQRWQENRTTQSRRDVTDNDFEDLVRAMEPPVTDEHPIIFQNGDDIGTWIRANTQVLK